MEMSLDEAIKHAEKTSEEKEKDARFYTFSRPDKYRKESSEKCAAEHRQLVEWLKDYKRLLEQYPVLDKIRAKIERHKSTIDKAISEDELKIEGMKEAYADCLEIIDEYKSESRGICMTEANEVMNDFMDKLFTGDKDGAYALLRQYSEGYSVVKQLELKSNMI